jgi:hypothetical protein
VKGCVVSAYSTALCEGFKAVLASSSESVAQIITVVKQRDMEPCSLVTASINRAMKRQSTCARLPGAISQKVMFFIQAAVRTSIKILQWSARIVSKFQVAQVRLMFGNQCLVT